MGVNLRPPPPPPERGFEEKSCWRCTFWPQLTTLKLKANNSQWLLVGKSTYFIVARTSSMIELVKNTPHAPGMLLRRDPTCVQKQKSLTWKPMSSVATRHFYKKKRPTISISGSEIAGTEVKKINWWEMSRYFWRELELKKNPNSKTWNLKKI